MKPPNRHPQHPVTILGKRRSIRNVIKNEQISCYRSLGPDQSVLSRNVAVPWLNNRTCHRRRDNAPPPTTRPAAGVRRPPATPKSCVSDHHALGGQFPERVRRRSLEVRLLPTAERADDATPSSIRRRYRTRAVVIPDNRRAGPIPATARYFRALPDSSRRKLEKHVSRNAVRAFLATFTDSRFENSF